MEFEVTQKTHLVVNETPLLEESVYAHDGADVTGKVSPTGSDGQVFDRAEAVGVDHEITVVLVDSRSLASVSVVEELGHGLTLDAVDGVHVEPGTVARQHDGMSLRNQVIASGTLGSLLGLILRSLPALSAFGTFSGSSSSLALGSRLLGLLGRVTHLLVSSGRGFGRGCLWRV